MGRRQYRALIVDLGDVLFTWSATTTTTVSGKTVKKIISSPTWSEYECGLITEEACYARSAEQFSLQPSDLAEAISQARSTIQSNDSMIAVIHELKEAANGALRVYAMSNMSKEDYAILSSMVADWLIFDQVFISGHVGMRKPNLSFYRHVLDSTHTDAVDAIFVDDKFENVFSARSVGLYGIIFDNNVNLTRVLRNALGDPIGRGRDFLSCNAGQLNSVTESNIIIHDNFAQLLILEATCNQNLVAMESHPRTWNFFIGKPILTTNVFPDDLDTTALALVVTRYDDSVAASVMDDMLRYVNEDGIIMTYFDRTRPRVDPVVCVNVLYLFYNHGRGHELRSTLDWVRAVLFHRAYTDGTRYYSSPDVFLHSLTRLLSIRYHAELHDDLGPLIKDRVMERVGAPGDSLSLAMRVLTCQAFGLCEEIDLRTLRALQCGDGGWEKGAIYKYGSSGMEIGNRGVATAFAINAIKGNLDGDHRGRLEGGKGENGVNGA